MVYRRETERVHPEEGAGVHQHQLADEINRAPAKVQSALLEAMEEHQVTIGDTTYPLPEPFFVLATPNPIEHEGTYPLPEAQLDRFVLKIEVGYPDQADEVAILRRMGVPQALPVRKALYPGLLAEIRETASSILIDERVEEYIVAVTAATRERDRNNLPFTRFIEYGASPRGTIYLYRCAKINALFEGRTFVLPEDVKAVAHTVLRHRVLLSYEAESEELTSYDVINQLLKAVQVP
jgi:MoxR-like ATPase